MEKIAVDSAAKDYWSKYFKEYGQMWVRDIPRRIKQATLRHFNASKIEGEFAPIAGNESEDGLLSIEAGFIGKIDNEDRKILVTASFNAKGHITEYICNPIS